MIKLVDLLKETIKLNTLNIKDVDVEKLNILKAEVDAYCIPLGIGEPEDNFVENTDFING